MRALHNVHMEVRKGEVHALLGENGAGKSTLMKILSGAYSRDTGEIYWEGQPIVIHNPREAQDLGIGIIYQEFNLIPQLSIAENVWISREPFRNRRLQLLDWKEMRRRTQVLLDDLHLPLDPRRPVAGLGVAQQQMVEIAKALSLDAKLADHGRADQRTVRNGDQTALYLDPTAEGPRRVSGLHLASHGRGVRDL